MHLLPWVPQMCMHQGAGFHSSKPCMLRKAGHVFSDLCLAWSNSQGHEDGKPEKRSSDSQLLSMFGTGTWHTVGCLWGCTLDSVACLRRATQPCPGVQCVSCSSLKQSYSKPRNVIALQGCYMAERAPRYLSGSTMGNTGHAYRLVQDMHLISVEAYKQETLSGIC